MDEQKITGPSKLLCVVFLNAARSSVVGFFGAHSVFVFAGEVHG